MKSVYFFHSWKVISQMKNLFGGRGTLRLKQKCCMVNFFYMAFLFIHDKWGCTSKGWFFFPYLNLSLPRFLTKTVHFWRTEKAEDQIGNPVLSHIFKPVTSVLLILVQSKAFLFYTLGLIALERNSGTYVDIQIQVQLQEHVPGRYLAQIVWCSPTCLSG
jgi:hypothetical protein